MRTSSFCLVLFLAHASLLQSAQRVTVTNFLKLPATEHSPAKHLPLFQLSFDNNNPITCNISPNTHNPQVVDTQGLEEAVSMFKTILHALSDTEPVQQKAVLQTVLNEQYVGILNYQELICSYDALFEHKDSGEELNSINARIIVLDREINPVLARLCFEQLRQLYKPEAPTPLIDFLATQSR